MYVLHVWLQFGPNGTEMATNIRMLNFLNALSRFYFPFRENAGLFVVKQEAIGLMALG